MNMLLPRHTKKSVQHIPVLRPAGHMPQVRNRLLGGGQIATVNVADWQGRSWDCEPRQLVYNFSHGNEQHLQPRKVGPPEMFWQAIGVDRQGPGYVLGTFQGEPGKPQGPVNWQPLKNSQVPSSLDGLVAKVSSNLGAERGQQNIVACRAEGTDVVATHISDPADRQLIVLNPDGWETDHPERAGLMEKLSRIDVTKATRTEMLYNDSGTLVTLRLYSDIINGATGQPYYHDLDVSCLKINPKEVYHDPADKRFSIKVIVPSEREDFETLKRERMVIQYNPSIRETDEAVVKTHKDEDNQLHVRIEPKISDQVNGNFVAAKLTDSQAVELTIASSYSEKTTVITAANETELAENPDFKAQEAGLQSSLLNAFHNVQPIEVSGSSRSAVKRNAKIASQSAAVKKAVAETLKEINSIENFTIEPPTRIRQRYVVQFYRPRESRLKDVLEKPLSPGQSVVVTKVETALEAVHLDSANGREKGAVEVMPLNFDPTYGKKDYDAIIFDPRPHALYSTRFVDPIGTAIAPQHLIDPFVMGTEIMAAVWPRVDQLGFFGVFPHVASYFPYGSQFCDPKNQPWYVRSFGTVSHSIFDQKADAGMQYYYLTGSRLLSSSKELVGAAMVTGPNTYAINPGREGKLFYSRIPGRRPFGIKTMMPGFYLTVIEDAQISYMEMRMFGLKTMTTANPLSAGGGLDNYQTALIVQRGQRWNAGLALWTLDTNKLVYMDLTRGSKIYNTYYNHTRKIWAASNKKTAAVKDPTGTLPPKIRANDPNAPTQKFFKWNEFREWLGVGTWYYVPIKLGFYVGLPLMIVSGILPLPVMGAAFLGLCLAATLAAWPFWAVQMAKVAVDPKTIFGFSPKNLFWNETAYTTQLKSGMDIERMSVGRFRISLRDAGNRILPSDKRTAVWLGMVAPLVSGTAILGLTAAVMLGMSLPLAPLAIAAAPFALGILASGYARRLAHRFLPNQNKHSFARTAVHFAARNLPLAAGFAGSMLIGGSLALAVVSVPLVTAIMAGGWAVFMGLNIANVLRIYHKEQREVSRQPAPNPLPGTLKPHQIDTWRNTFREARGIMPPAYEANEFTSNNDSSVSPEVYWEALQGFAPARALGSLPKYGDLRNHLIDHSIYDASGNLSPYYDHALLNQAVKAAGNFEEKFGLSPQELRETLDASGGLKRGLLANPGGNPLANLNSLINGEGGPGNEVMIDLHTELADVRPQPTSRRRRRKIAKLSRDTAEVRETWRGLPRKFRTAEGLKPNQYQKWRELNRLVLEDTLNTPKRGDL